ELMDALGLPDDRLQRRPESVGCQGTGIRSQGSRASGQLLTPDSWLLAKVSQEVLSLPGDDRQGVVDFVPGAGGKLGQGPQFLCFQLLRLTASLILQRSVQDVQLLLQSGTATCRLQPSVLRGQFQEVNEGLQFIVYRQRIFFLFFSVHDVESLG